jgi:hypothetical protein
MGCNRRRCASRLSPRVIFIIEGYDEPQFMLIDSSPSKGRRKNNRGFLSCDISTPPNLLRRKLMKLRKYPKWDKQKKESQQILFNPNTPINETLKIGQKAVGTIRNVEIAVLLTKLINDADAEGKIIRIGPINADEETLGDLRIGDIVFITRSDMSQWDTAIP